MRRNFLILMLPFCHTNALISLLLFFFFFNDTATTEIYTLSLHDALPFPSSGPGRPRCGRRRRGACRCARSEEHTSELQSQFHLVCRLLLEKKKKPLKNTYITQKKKKRTNKQQHQQRQ